MEELDIYWSSSRERFCIDSVYMYQLIYGNKLNYAKWINNATNIAEWNLDYWSYSSLSDKYPRIKNVYWIDLDYARELCFKSFNDNSLEVRRLILRFLRNLDI